MSFFDDVVTAVENTRLIKAVQDATSAPVELELRPYESLSEKAAKLREAPMPVRKLLCRNTVLNYCYLLLIRRNFHSGLEDVATLIDMMHEFTKLNPLRRREAAPIILRKLEDLADQPLVVDSEATISIDFDISSGTGAPAPKGPRPPLSGSPALTPTVSPTEPVGIEKLDKPQPAPKTDKQAESSSAEEATKSAETGEKTALANEVEMTSLKPAKSDKGSEETIASTESNETETPSTPKLPAKEGPSDKNLEELSVEQSEECKADPPKPSKSSKKKTHSELHVDQNKIPVAPISIATAWARRCRYYKFLARVERYINSDNVPPHLFDECLNQGLGPLLVHTIAPFRQSTFFELYVQLDDFIDHPLSLRDFKFFRTLGRGTFGAVFAGQERQTHAVYAVKQISKKMVKSANKGYEWMVQNEQRMLKTMNSPYVLNLKASLDDNDYLYLIFDICTGGDLGFHIKNQPEHRFTLERARFYAAQVLLGLEHMHSHNIVYRDLKPSNILLDEDGNVKLSDLGLSIRLHPSKLLKHVAGTAGYWAPEILAKTGTYKSSDFWSFGVLLFEMMAGHRPILQAYLHRYSRYANDGYDDEDEEGNQDEVQKEQNGSKTLEAINSKPDGEPAATQASVVTNLKQEAGSSKPASEADKSLQSKRDEKASTASQVNKSVAENVDVTDAKKDVSKPDTNSTSKQKETSTKKDSSVVETDVEEKCQNADESKPVQDGSVQDSTIEDKTVASEKDNATSTAAASETVIDKEKSVADDNKSTADEKKSVADEKKSVADEGQVVAKANESEGGKVESSEPVKTSSADKDEDEKEKEKEKEKAGEKPLTDEEKLLQSDTQVDDENNKSSSTKNRYYDRSRVWSPFSNSPGHDTIAREPGSILDVDIDYPNTLNRDLKDLLRSIFNPDPLKRLGANGVEEIKNHPFFSCPQDGLPPIDWDQLAVKDTIPPYKPEALKVHAHSVDQVGAFDEGKWRSIKLTEKDNEHYAKWNYINRANREQSVAAVLPLLKLDENGRVFDDSANKRCCTIM